MTFRHRPYVVMSGYMWERKETFRHFFPALLTYITRARANEDHCGANIVNLDLSDYDHHGLTESEQCDLEEYTP